MKNFKDDILQGGQPAVRAERLSAPPGSTSPVSGGALGLLGLLGL